MASSSAKATYKTNGYNTWKKSDSEVADSSGVSTSGPQSSLSGFLKSWFGPSPGSSTSISKDVRVQSGAGGVAGSGAGVMPGPTRGGQAAKKDAPPHKRVDSLDIGRRLGQCYAESASMSSSGSKGRSDHSQLSLATQLSLSSSGKISRSGHRPQIDHCHRRMPSCDMYKYNNEYTRQAVSPSGELARVSSSQGGGPVGAGGGHDPKAKNVVIMEE